MTGSPGPVERDPRRLSCGELDRIRQVAGESGELESDDVAALLAHVDAQNARIVALIAVAAQNEVLKAEIARTGDRRGGLERARAERDRDRHALTGLVLDVRWVALLLQEQEVAFAEDLFDAIEKADPRWGRPDPRWGPQ